MALLPLLHDGVIKWKHFPRNWPFVRGIHRFPVNSPHKDQWRGALMFSLICVWINDWVNNRETGDLRRYRAHYDVIVMIFPKIWLYFLSRVLVPWWRIEDLKIVSDELRFLGKNYICIFSRIFCFLVSQNIQLSDYLLFTNSHKARAVKFPGTISQLSAISSV